MNANFKDTMKILEILQKQSVEKAKKFLENPDKAMADALRKFGIASRSEVEALEARIEALERELKGQGRTDKKPRAAQRQ